VTLEQLLAAAVGGSPVAIVVGVALKIVWSRYQQALLDMGDLPQALHDRDAAELEALRGMVSMGESSSENA